VRVIETAIEVFADNDKKLSYFKKRLAKLKWYSVEILPFVF
jgi:hypothetical protein